jgi:hypothetical protein
MLKSIYNVNTKFLVIDIETTLEGQIFDIAFAIYSRKEGIIGSAGYFVKEYPKDRAYYKVSYKHRAYKKEPEPFAKIMAIMAGIIRKYNPDYATAYNSGFDFGKIAEGCNFYKIANPLENLVEVDLYHLACQTLGKQKWFKEFVDKNKLLTPKGNRKSSAEVMYAYMILDPDFEEEHTGLGDIEIEVQILDRVIRQKKKMNLGRNKEAWKIVQG